MTLARTLAVALALFLAGAAPPAIPPTPGQLMDSAWRVTTIDGRAPVSQRAVIRFLGNRLSASAGCNGLGGTWRLQGSRLVGGPFISTMMFCEGVMEQERAMADLLGSRPKISIQRGLMQLQGGGHRLEARRLPGASRP